MGNERPQESEAGIGFLVAEAEVGLTFASIALNAGHDVEKIERNTRNARAAYDSILRFRERVLMDAGTSIKLNGQISELRSKLRELGEDV